MSRTLGSDTPDARLRALEQRIEAIERRQPERISMSDGTRVRVRLGKQDDGKFGVRVWDAAGGVAHDWTA